MDEWNIQETIKQKLKGFKDGLNLTVSIKRNAMQYPTKLESIFNQNEQQMGEDQVDEMRSEVQAFMEDV